MSVPTPDTEAPLAPASGARHLLRSTATVGGFTFISRILGFARDVILARYFGAGPVMDAFFVAFKIPNFFRRLFAEGAFSQAFVPVLGEVHTRQGHEETRRLIAETSGTLGFILVIFSLLGILLAPYFIDLFAPGFAHDPATHRLATELLRLTFPYLFFIALTALAAGALNVHGRFAVPAATPILLNVSLIAAALWLTHFFAIPVLALGVGVLAAGLLQFLFQLPFLSRLKLLSRPRWAWRKSSVQQIFHLMLPALFGASVMQINLLVDTAIASFLNPGSVSWLYYSDRLMEFPLGVFAIALGTVILPGLTRAHTEQSPGEFSQLIDTAMRLVVLLALPAAIGLGVLAGPLIVTLFRYGAFSRFDARMSEASLMAYALGLIGFTAVKILAPGFYAQKDTRTPVRIAIWAIGANLAFNALIVIPWVIEGWPAPHAGLALSTSLAALLNALLLARGLRRSQRWQHHPGWSALIVRVLVALLAMGVVLVSFEGPLRHWFQWPAWTRIWHLSALIGAGFLIYGLMLWIQGLGPGSLYRMIASARDPAPGAS
jgi:putative peptidoglycan lipid II flippase